MAAVDVDATRRVLPFLLVPGKSEEMIFGRSRADPSPRAENLFKI